eukprot:536900-Hanusia_phi.AAC.1
MNYSIKVKWKLKKNTQHFKDKKVIKRQHDCYRFRVSRLICTFLDCIFDMTERIRQHAMGQNILEIDPGTHSFPKIVMSSNFAMNGLSSERRPELRANEKFRCLNFVDCNIQMCNHEECEEA